MCSLFGAEEWVFYYYHYYYYYYYYHYHYHYHYYYYFNFWSFCLAFIVYSVNIYSSVLHLWEIERIVVFSGSEAVLRVSVLNL